MKQNKKIAKEMRHKNISLTDYPCENQLLLDNEGHEFMFYEVTMPKWMKEGEQGRAMKEYEMAMTMKKQAMLSQQSLAQLSQQSSSQNEQLN